VRNAIVRTLRQAPDIVLVSLGTTLGWRRVDEAFVELVREAGATCDLVPTRLGSLGRLRRTMFLTDLVEAYAARRSAAGVRAGAIVYSSVTAALLQPSRGPYAVRFDSFAAINRPGIGGGWQRRRERAVMHRARLLLPLGEAGAAAAEAAFDGISPAIVLPPPIEAVNPGAERDLDAIAYAANPHKRGLELICEAWARAERPDGARMIVGGIDRTDAKRYLRRAGVAEPPDVEWAGAVPPERWLTLVGRARVFVNASRYEDWGLAQMEALAAGTPLVTVQSPGLNEALPLARRLAPALVADEPEPAALATAIEAGLALDDHARADYGRRAEALMQPYRRPAIRRTIAEQVLPQLLGRPLEHSPTR
jgi:glycosyltransferase involved in cell wall biosynthesis